MSTEPQTVAQRYPGLAFVGFLVVVAVIALFWFLASRAGPGSRTSPILTGTAESGTFWKYPLTATSNEGSPVKGYRIEVYETFVVATNPETGAKHIKPHGSYSDLVVK